MRTHHVDPVKYERATSSGNIGLVMALRMACGTRSTSRAQVEMSTKWENVDCLKCLTHQPAKV